MHSVMHNSRNCSIGNLIQEKCLPAHGTFLQHSSELPIPQMHSNFTLILARSKLFFFYAKPNTVFKGITSDKHARLQGDFMRQKEMESKGKTQRD